MPFKFGSIRITSQGATGGNGSTVTFDLTAVTPLIAHNNIISLEIDDQTLKVNDNGHLTVNLDELGNEVNSIAGDVALLDKNKANINLSNISEVGKEVIKANSAKPNNMVTTDTDQIITGAKTFNNAQVTFGGETLDRTKLLFKTANATLEGIGLDYSTNEAIIKLGSTMGKTVICGTEVVDVNENNFLTTANMPLATVATAGVIKPDGKTVTVSDTGILSAKHIESVGEKYGIRGDYSTQFGILECPDGILEVSGMDITLLPKVVLQCAGQESKTMISGRLTHTITSTSDIDIFYSKGQLLECGNVYYQEEEPEDGTDNFVAWWQPSVGQWQFKSNDTGNVFRTAIACRIAHIHTDGKTITRVDYIGNRILDDEIFALKSEMELGLSEKADISQIPASTSLLQGASLYPIATLPTNATQTQILQKVNEIIAILVSRGVARIQGS